MYWVVIDYAGVPSTVDMSPSPEFVKHQDGRETIVRSDMQFTQTLLRNRLGKTLLTRDCIKHWNTILRWCSDNCIGDFALHVAKDYRDVMWFRLVKDRAAFVTKFGGTQCKKPGRAELRDNLNAVIREPMAMAKEGMPGATTSFPSKDRRPTRKPPLVKVETNKAHTVPVARMEIFASWKRDSAQGRCVRIATLHRRPWRHAPSMTCARNSHAPFAFSCDVADC